MNLRKNSVRKMRVLEGNEATAYGVLLCQPDVIALYPITPQTSILDYLYEFRVDGSLKSEMLSVESEHSAMSALIGAAKAGGRTFTATAAQGLAFMYEPYILASTSRLPIVMVIACRQMQTPPMVGCSEEDAMLVRDAGWIQFHAESCQEILDTIIMAYKLAEDSNVLLPVNVCYDGFYLSYLSEAVDVPTQEQVEEFLPPRDISLRLEPQKAMGSFGGVTGIRGTEYRYKHAAAMERTKAKIDEFDQEFQQVFGRGYGGQIEEYRCEDADIVLVAVGSCAGTIKVVVDKKRDEGAKVGLIRVRSFRPFPRERLLNALMGKKAIGVIDRNVCFGWSCGTLFMELKASLYDLHYHIPAVNFIDGLSGQDITIRHIERAIDIIYQVAQGKIPQEVTWLGVE
jgi:phenylglyoxylate dehydrogenase alpha subunit